MAIGGEAGGGMTKWFHRDIAKLLRLGSPNRAKHKNREPFLSLTKTSQVARG